MADQVVSEVTSSSDWQFWWNWSVQLAVAIGTIAAALVALFGEQLRALIFRPKLQLRLVPGYGVRTPAQLTGSDGATRQAMTRYHHVEASNKASWRQAKRAQVYLTRVERLRPDGEMRTAWTGAIPIRWRFQEVEPLTRTLGPAFCCDLCSVIERECLLLHPLVYPNNLACRFSPPVDIAVTLQIRSDDGVSPERRFRIFWDGQWRDGDREMAEHFFVQDKGDVSRAE